MQENRELLDAATRGEWMLEHDKKVLEIMQNIASVFDKLSFLQLSFILTIFELFRLQKIEKRAVNTKTSINTMMLSMDETRVKMSNLTRISDVKNTVYCENLITNDHTLPSNSCDAQVTKKPLVNKNLQAIVFTLF
jgi:hypothetical protein